MKIVTLLFACVALLTFTKVGAMNADSGAVRGGSGTAPPTHYPAREIDDLEDGSEASHGGGGATLQNEHPDIGPWANHRHTHPTKILNPVPGHPRRPQRQIRIVKVVNGHLTDYHLLQGELVHDYEIISCHGPHGYAIVDLNNRERLYACLKPYFHHQESINRERTGDPPIYLAVILEEGKPRLDANLAPRDETPAFESRTLLYHCSFERAIFGRGPFGRVRYILPNGTEVEGPLYKYI